MNKDYLNQLNKRLMNNRQLSKTEKQIVWAYRDMLEYEYDWIGFRKITDIDPEELPIHMLAAGIDRIYVTEEWSEQFENWYKMQEAGFNMCMKLIDNPRYQHEQMFSGRSNKDKKMIVMVFELMDDGVNDDDYDYTPSAENDDYSPSHPWDAPGMSISDFI